MQLRQRVAILAVLVAACGTATPSATPTISTPPLPSGSPASPSAVPATGGTGTPVPSAGAEDTAATSTDLITAAVAAGQVDFPTSLLYRAQALFGDPALPAEFAAAEGPEEDLGVFLLPAAMGDALPADVRQQLEPYLVTPIDPRSAFYRGDTAAPVASLNGMAVEADPACGPTGWTSQESTVHAFKVWAKCTGNYAADIATTLALTESEFPAMTALMGEPVLDTGTDLYGGNAAIDIYLSDDTVCPDAQRPCFPITGNVLGWAMPIPPHSTSPGAASSGYIVMRRARLADPAGYRSTLIHEFFHVLEFAHNTAALGEATGIKDVNGQHIWDNFWFFEAAAKWSQWHFEAQAGRQQAADAVHWWFTNVFQTVDRPLDALEPPSHRYSAYVWPMLIAQQQGPQGVAASWDAIRPADTWAEATDAMASRFSFSTHFREFAIQNFNINVNAHGDDPRPTTWQDTFPTFPEMRPQGLKWRLPEVAETEGNPVVLNENLQHLAAHYYQVAFDEDASKITIDATGLAPYESVDLDVLIQIGDAADNRWRHERLNAETEWCDTRPDEDVRHMFLIVSNHSLTEIVRGPIEIQAMGVECAEGSGTVTITRGKHGTYTSNRNNPVEVDMTDQATITFDLVPDPYNADAFISESSSITWSYSLSAVESADGCTIEQKAGGGGTWEGSDGPTVLLGWSAPDGTLASMGLNESKYVLNAFPPTQNMPDEDPSGWYQVSSTLCGGDLIPGTWLPYATFAIVDGALPEDLTGTLSGSRTRTLPPSSPMDVETVETVTWSFTLTPTE